MIVGAGLVTLGWLSLARADWPMPGHDAQRSSWASEDEISPPPTKPLWATKFDPYVPLNFQLVTSSVENKIFVTAADGIHALDPTTGIKLWHYPMALPPGQAPTYRDKMLFIAGTDKTVHAIDAATGTKIWQTAEAGMGFNANPIVENNRVYVGNLDGHFYCFEANTGNYLWSYNATEPIQQSAAFKTYPNHPKGVIFFAARDLRAHALDADTGQLIWRSEVLTGAERFQVYWPVAFEEIVLFVGGTVLPAQDNASITNQQREGIKTEYAQIPVSNGWYDFKHHQDFLTSKPWMRTTFVLGRSDGKPPSSPSPNTPFMHCGPQEVFRSPPIIGPNPAGGSPASLVWSRSPWKADNEGGFFGFGRFMGWQVGTSKARLAPGLLAGLESSDEGENYSMIGSTYIYSSKGEYGEGGFEGGLFAVSGNEQFINLEASPLGSINSRMSERKYHIGMNDGNAPVPLGKRIYLHKSCTVISFGQ